MNIICLKNIYIQVNRVKYKSDMENNSHKRYEI